ncbi:MAG TPA: hypothetical protein DDW90_07160 [Cyanobacteria bacterium UBA9971]|nr:hypothetical protein [Cyanobacteria bacterium UBA9971]
MESIISNKPNISVNFGSSEHKKQKNNILPATAATVGIAGAFGLVDGMATQGNLAAKTGVALNSAKNVGFFLAGAALCNKVANTIINKVPFLKNFKEDHPGLTSIGIIIAEIVAGNKVQHYGNKVLTKLLKKQPIEKLNEVLQKSTILTNNNAETVVKKINIFATNSKVRFLGKAAMLGMGVLFVKNIFDLGKMDYKLSKTKQS